MYELEVMKVVLSINFTIKSGLKSVVVIGLQGRACCLHHQFPLPSVLNNK